MANVGADIAFSQVGYSYRDGAEEVRACRDVSFDVAAGEAVALIGPSGCGKSTTLYLAAGLMKPSCGEVRIGGQPVSRPRIQTAFIPQDLGLFPWKNVLRNAMLPLTLRGVSAAEASERARRALGEVGLGGFERAWPKELSGGMRQRLALARALAMEADLLLMDEPLSAIDALLRESLQEMLLELWRERRHTQMLVTHSIEEAIYLGQRILVFSERPGTIVADLPNPHMGEPGWRGSAEFANQCQRVRRALGGEACAQTPAGQEAGEAGEGARP